MKPKYFLCFLLIFSMLTFAGCMNSSDDKDTAKPEKNGENVEERIGDDVREGARDVRDKVDDMTDMDTDNGTTGPSVSGAAQKTK